ncbi:transmembrane protein 237-like [Dysidea avara]|uniref:transmembrane protein 237-like n=1 Tax=Dysidea avara TaxID=196820 RepID=UPI003329F430
MDGRELPSSQSYTDSGPISVSDLLKSTTSNNATKKRKEFRRQKPTDHARDSANKAASRDGVPLEQPTEPHTNSSTIEAPILNRLRSRLDPIYNPSSDMPSQAAADSDSSAAPVEKSVKRTKKKRKGKKPRNTEEEATQDSVDQPVATVTALSTETDKPADNTTENQERLLLSSPLRQLPAEPAELDNVENQDRGLPESNRYQPGKQYFDPEDPHLLVSEEDIVEGNIDELVTDTLPQDQPRVIERPSTVFVEQKGKRGFIEHKREELNAPVMNRRDTILPLTIVSTTQLCMYIHIIISKISNAAHGLLAGLSLWECIMVNLLAKEEPEQVLLLQFYSMLSLPSHFVHLFLSILVIISLLDRLDVVKTSKTCLDTFIKMPHQISIIISLGFLLIAYVFTLSIVAIDERISLISDAPDEWLDVLETSDSPPVSPDTIQFVLNGTVYVSSGSTSSRVDSWLAINTVRAICYNLSWMLSVWLVSYNRLEERLKV